MTLAYRTARQPSPDVTPTVEDRWRWFVDFGGCSGYAGEWWHDLLWGA
jgi:hypothetical protein